MIRDIGSYTARPIAETAGDAGGGPFCFSPDGRWIAYTSDESGASQVYAVPYGGGRKAQVSVDGGRMPRWNPAGGELFFLDDAGLMVAAVEPVADGGAFRAGIPVRLFENAALAGFDVGSTS
jgi:Tol biopolymer transport system component